MKYRYNVNYPDFSGLSLDVTIKQKNFFIVPELSYSGSNGLGFGLRTGILLHTK